MHGTVHRLLTTISALVGRWDALTGHPLYRVTGVILGLGVFTALLLAPSPPGLSVLAHRTGAVAVLMALWWVGRVLPMAITALVPLVAFPLLGVLSVKDAALPFAHPLNVLMLGGFVIGHAMEEAGLHERLVAGLLRPAWIRASPGRVLLALMLAAAVLSGLVSNTATTLMLLPVAIALGRVCTSDARLQTAFVLGLAYAASLGGVGTIIGTPPNAVLAGLRPQVTFARWAAVGVPFVALGVPVAWWVVTRVALPLPRRFDKPPQAPALPRWSLAEASIVGLLALALLGWFTHKPVPLGAFTLPGWSQGFAERWTHDALVAIGIAVLLFLVPALPAERRKHPGSFLLSIRRLDRGVPWSVLLLLGGGFSLAAAVKATRLTEWLTGATTGLAALQDAFGEGSVLGLALAVLVLCLIMTFLTELTSNTATSQIVLPVLAAGAASAGIDPLVWMIPATISASCAFMMPVATAPNAIASQAGQVAPGDMAWGGLVLNVCLAVLVTIVAVVWVPWVFE